MFTKQARNWKTTWSMDPWKRTLSSLSSSEAPAPNKWETTISKASMAVMIGAASAFPPDHEDMLYVEYLSKFFPTKLHTKSGERAKANATTP